MKLALYRQGSLPFEHPVNRQRSSDALTASYSRGGPDRRETLLTDPSARTVASISTLPCVCDKRARVEYVIPKIFCGVTSIKDSLKAETPIVSMTNDAKHAILMVFYQIFSA